MSNPLDSFNEAEKQVVRHPLSLAQDEREDFLCRLGEVFCRHCWTELDGGRCYCWNDE